MAAAPAIGDGKPLALVGNWPGELRLVEGPSLAETDVAVPAETALASLPAPVDPVDAEPQREPRPARPLFAGDGTGEETSLLLAKADESLSNAGTRVKPAGSTKYPPAPPLPNTVLELKNEDEDAAAACAGENAAPLIGAAAWPGKLGGKKA